MSTWTQKNRENKIEITLQNWQNLAAEINYKSKLSFFIQKNLDVCKVNFEAIPET